MARVYKRNDKETGTPRRGAKWIMRYKNEKGLWKDKSSGTSCKQTAQAQANQLEAAATKQRSGLIDTKLQGLQEEASRPIQEHVDAFQAKMKNADTSPKHVAEQVSILQAFIKFENPKSAAQIDQESVQSYLTSLRESGRSNRTLQKHLTCLRTFFKWMIQTGKLDQNPTRGIKKPRPEKDRRHQRRMLTREEWDWLASATAKGKERWKMTGLARHLLYWTAIETGYRSNELRQIKVSNLQTLDGKHFIWIDGDTTKNGSPARQYLSEQLAIELVSFAEGMRPAELLFTMPFSTNVVKMLRADLDASRNAWLNEVVANEAELARRQESDFLVYEDEEARKLDFHALRHTCGAWLIIAGVDIKTVQTIMRHSTPMLTLNTYGHLMEGAEARAIETLDAGAQQICSKLPAAEEILDATECEDDAQTEKVETKKDPSKTGVSATQCKIFPSLAKAPRA